MTGGKKTHWLRNTLIVLVVCGLAGTALAAALFHKEENRTYASSSIQFSFKGADEGTAPNGYRFDGSGFSRDEVLDAALEASGLTGTYTSGQLRDNLSVTGVYPGNIAEEIARYVSPVGTGASEQAMVPDYYTSQYNVKLYNGFDQKISSGKLKELLGNIMSAYQAYFAESYSTKLFSANMGEADYAALKEYDYDQQLDIIGESVRQQCRYAEEMAERAPGFMLDRKGFGDIVMRYRNLQKDIENLSASVKLNAVSKDRGLMRKRYETELRTLQNSLPGLAEEQKQIDGLMTAYDKEGLIYISENGLLSAVGGNDSGIYDKLAEKRKAVTDRIAGISADIILLKTWLGDVTDTAKPEEGNSGEPDEALKAFAESRIGEITAGQNDIASDFKAMLDAYTAQEINGKTVFVTGVKYNSPTLLSGRFVEKAVKTAGPLCAVGFLICIALLVRNRRKEEE